jgi:hypothetical protein
MLVHREGAGASSRLRFAAELLHLWVDADFFVDNEQAMEASYAKFTSVTAPMSHYLGGFGARIYGRIDDAIARFSLARAQCAGFASLEAVVDFELGWSHFIRCDWVTCISLLEGFLGCYRGAGYVSFAAYLLGTARLMVGDEVAAHTAFDACIRTARPNFSYDQVWMHECRTRVICL